MSCDDDADEDAPGFRQPPHPDDRLWRHPSEMAAHPVRPIGAFTGRAPASHQPWRAVAAASAFGIATVAAGLTALAVSGTGSGQAEDPTEVRSTAAEPGGVDPAAAADRVGPAVVEVGSGSGVVVRADGLVLTSSTLVAGGETVEVRLPDGRPVEAQVVGADPVTGIGVLDLPGDGHPAAELAAGGATPEGVAVTVGAAPAGDDAAVSSGVIGGTRKLGGGSGEELDGVVEVESGSDPRALGGPVVGESGPVIGVTTALDGDRSSYFTPIEVGSKVAHDLLDFGRVRHGWLGIEGRDRPEGSAPPGAGGRGAEIVTVFVTSSASAAGLRPGDVVVELAGRRIEQMSDLVGRLRSQSPGDEVEITVERDGELVTVVAVLGERATP